MLVASPIHQILDLARWAPSGDNTQPWRFDITSDTKFVIYGFDTRESCIYDLDGHASQMSLGALIETIHIAASAFGYRVDVARRPNLTDSKPIFDVSLELDTTITKSRLLSTIPERSVQRRPFSTRRLTLPQKVALEGSLDEGYRILWIEGALPKWRTAMLMFANAKLRLTTEEAYRVHHDIIDWGPRYSAERVPAQALGVDRLTLKLMQWIMCDWNRVKLFNRFLAGTWMPRIQMDLLPSLRCGAHFVLVRQSTPISIDDYIESGRMVQRLWLTATAVGLVHQPELTPLIFSRYVRESIVFSHSQSALALARRLSRQTSRLIGPELSNAVWIGRVGTASQPLARSTRRSLRSLVRSYLP